jgi:FkbM family methyltransferase
MKFHKIHKFLRKTRSEFNENVINYMILFYRNLSNFQNVSLTHGERLFSQKLSARNMNVIDAGARTDTFLAEIFQGSDNLIYLLEPNPRFCKVLRKKIKTKSLKNTKVIQIAIGDHEGEFVYYRNSQSLLPRNVYGKKHDLKRLKKTVRVTTLDSLVRQYKIKRPLFIKTDLEMYDYLALMGGKESINNIADVVQFELGLETSEVNKQLKILDFINLFEGNWLFYVLNDTNNGFLEKICKSVSPMIRLKPENHGNIESAVLKGLTFNLVAIRPELENNFIDLIANDVSF